jgi:hypothetical protein
MLLQSMRHTTEQSVKYAGLIAFIPYHTLSKTFHKLRQSVAGAKRTLVPLHSVATLFAHSISNFAFTSTHHRRTAHCFDDAACITKHSFKLPQLDFQVNFRSSLHFLGIQRARHSS